MNTPLRGFQKRYLRGLAHNRKPVIFIGGKGINEPLIKSVKETLNTHELIKIKFLDFKDKQSKNEILESILKSTNSQLVGLIGHIATLYRTHSDPEKRKIVLPEK